MTSTPEMLGAILAGLAEVHEKLVARTRDAEVAARRATERSTREAA